MSDLDSTAAWAAAHGGSATKLGVIGFCRGGRQTWLYAAHNPTLKAAVAFYGPVMGTKTDIQPRTVAEIADQIKCPLLGLYGAKDPGIAVDDVRAAEAKAKAAGKSVDIVVYPDAGHGFHADYRPSYRQADADDGWKRAIAWFQANGLGASA
jgi:carboxymethylenebutenolidase